MLCNLSTLDRGIRIMMGLGCVGGGLLATQAELSGLVSGSAYVMGFYALASGLIGFCPMCKVFGIDTCGFGKKKPND